jgi:hypothetical protein
MTITNETGAYVLPNLALGSYRLEASLPGFRSCIQTGIVLQVNSSPVVNPVLEVGQVSEQIEVQTNAALVETRNVRSRSDCRELQYSRTPLNGRNVQDLITLAGGAVAAGDSGTRFFPGSPYVSFGGAPQGFGVDYSLDGAQHFNLLPASECPCRFPTPPRNSKSKAAAWALRADAPLPPAA